MTLSLRGRLLIGVISLLVIGLLVFNIATYLALQSFLISRVDAQLRAGIDEVANTLGAPSRGAVQHTAFPVGTVAELLGTDPRWHCRGAARHRRLGDQLEGGRPGIRNTHIGGHACTS